MKLKGFTLIELITVVAIISILAAIGIVSYNGYVWSTKKTSAKNIMQQMSLAQTEYISNNGNYYYTSGGCSSSTTQQIITDLFDGNKDLSEKDFYYCISGNSSSNTFKITAKNIITNCQVMRDEKNNITDSGC